MLCVEDYMEGGQNERVGEAQVAGSGANEHECN